MGAQEQQTGDDIDLDAVRAARSRIGDRVHRTPVFSATLLGRSADVSLHLKCENLQKTGSFKPRGVLNRVLQLDQEERATGVVTVSAGNHAQALAWGARSAGVDAVVVMPEDAPRAKVEASRGYGAEVVLHGTVFDAFERAERLSEEEGYTFVHPFDQPEIIAGQGTAGLELMEDLPDLDAVVVPVGGGGLLAGIAVAVREQRPDVRVYGVEPQGADSMRRSLEAGEPVHLDEVDTIADGLGSPMAGDLTYPLIRRHVDDVVVVSDDEIAAGVGGLLTWTKLLAEPAGAAGVAALLAGRVPVDPGGRVAAVVSGGNVDLDALKEMI